MKRGYLTVSALLAPLAMAGCSAQDVAKTAKAADVMTPPIVLASNDPLGVPLPVANAEPAADAQQPQANDMDMAEMLRQRQAQRQQQAAPAPAAADAPAAQLPAGHPPLPAGHPPIAPQQSNVMRTASTKPSMIGSLTIAVVNATAGAKAPGAVPVMVELYKDDQVIDKNEAKLNEDGSLTIDSIPVSLGVTPHVKVTYQGVEYEAAGEVMDGTHPDQRIQVQVYDATETAPAWTIKMQHLITTPTVAGVQVTEMVVVDNPTDRSWVGKAGGDGKRQTLTFPLPAGATNVQLGNGFHGCCVKVEADRVVDSMALQPGTSQYSLSYVVPVKNAAADLAFATPAPVKHLMVFVPDDNSNVVPTGLEASGVANMGRGKTRFYKATDLPGGQSLKLAISNITATAPVAQSVNPGDEAATSSTAPAMSANVAKLVAGAGGLVIFLVGGMFLLVKAPKQGKRVKKA
jgi:hypothetical protein